MLLRHDCFMEFINVASLHVSIVCGLTALTGVDLLVLTSVQCEFFLVSSPSHNPGKSKNFLYVGYTRLTPWFRSHVKHHLHCQFNIGGKIEILHRGTSHLVCGLLPLPYTGWLRPGWCSLDYTQVSQMVYV